MKNKVIAVIICIILSLPAFAEEGIVQEETLQTANPAAGTTETLSGQEETVLPSENVELQDSLKKPVSKKKIARKFLLAMFGVLVSSLIIFAGLSIYNSVRNIATSVKETGNEETSSLEVPDNLNDAIKSFFDRTHWDT